MKLSLALSFAQRLYVAFALLLIANAGVAACLLVWVHDTSLSRGLPATDRDVLDVALWTLASVLGASLAATLAAIAWLTRPPSRLTVAIRHAAAASAPGPASTAVPANMTGEAVRVRAATAAFSSRALNEARHVDLETAFDEMNERIAHRWHALSQQTRHRHALAMRLARDLRTPAESLTLYLDAIADKHDAIGDNDRRRHLGVALDQSRKVGALAHALFEVERLEHGLLLPEIRALDLPALVHESFMSFELAAEARNITLCATISPGLRPVNADAAMIERVLTHLLDNAVRHTPYDGVIEVTLETADECVAVTLSDTGPGIAREKIEAVCRVAAHGVPREFVPAGLGLLVVHRLLALHHSQLRLIECAGKGAVLRFDLPCVPDPVQRKTAP
ncbi:MAG TPA: HAMP domain-containing sensor histidine kinase [Pararobbsia sp.]|nr:HAMP domain-containing sensor histidine kinase [Pararobbsia sp.]